MVKKKIDSRVLAKQKRGRRAILSFGRVCRYGIDSFLRNSWLSVAATAVMTIALMIIFISFISQNVLTDTVNQLRKKVDMSIYLKNETTDTDAKIIMDDLKKLSSVRSVRYISAKEVRDKTVEDNKNNISYLNAIKEAKDNFPATIRVVIADVNDPSQLQSFVKNNMTLKKFINVDHAPSFAGERVEAIRAIGRGVNLAQKVGIIAGSVFVAISSLIIFNTIRMAIFNRREEIQMMKLIGANQSFIRGPFLVESIIYGFIAAIITTLLCTFGLSMVSEILASYQISILPTVNLITQYWFLVLAAMIGLGAAIGIVSSMLATHRYLKL